MDKHEVARILDEMGILLEMKGENRFKIRAYHVAARTIEGLDVDLRQLVKRRELEELPGIGESIAKKITALVETGRLPEYEKLKKSVPSALLEMLEIPGLGAKKIITLHKKLQIDSKRDLLKACHEGKIAKLAGFGKKSQQNILEGISKRESYSRRMLWWNAAAIGEPILEQLLGLKGVKKAELAGSLRRKLETVGDLDFVVATTHPAPIMRWFTEQGGVERVLSKGPTKSSVRLKEGMQADIRIVPPDQFAFALLYFTGSKEHNIEMRLRAHKKGWLLNEYGLKPLAGKKPIPKNLHSEAAIFKAFGLSYIAPELRENQGEIEAAEKGKLPKLIEESDIRGAFHCHTTESDGHHTLEEMAKAAEQKGWEYLGISDHSKSSFQAHGMDEKRLFAQMAKIKKLNASKRFKVHLFAGLECDILNSGQLDFPDTVLKELDFVIVSIHRSFNLDEKTMTKRLIRAIENPYTTMVGHLTGRLLLKRDPYKVNITKVIDACIANHKIMELNAHPMRLDMDWRLWRKARDKGLKCSINPDAHRMSDLDYVLAGVNTARKGWLEKEDVINTLSLARVRRLLSLKKIEEGLELFGACRVAHFAQRFCFDLTDPFACDVKPDAHLFQCFGLAIEKTKALDQHFAFAIGQRRENFVHLVFQDRVAGRFCRRIGRGIFQEVAKLALIAHFCLQRDRMLRDFVNLANALRSEAKLIGKLFWSRLSACLHHQFFSAAQHLIDRLDHVDRDTDRARLVGNRACHRLTDPPGGIGREFITAAVFKLFNRLHQAHIPLLDQIEEGKAAVGVFFCDRDHEAQVGFDHLAFGFLALVHPALKHADIFFEVIESAACSKFSFCEFSLCSRAVWQRQIYFFRLAGLSSCISFSKAQKAIVGAQDHFAKVFDDVVAAVESAQIGLRADAALFDLF